MSFMKLHNLPLREVLFITVSCKKALVTGFMVMGNETNYSGEMRCMPGGVGEMGWGIG